MLATTYTGSILGVDGLLVRVERSIDPAAYECTAVAKLLGAQKRFPALLFERPLNLHGRPGEVRLLLNAETTQGKIQVALGMPPTTSRAA